MKKPKNKSEKKLKDQLETNQEITMTLSQKRKVITVASLPVAAIVLILSFQNCSPGNVQSAKLESTSSAASTNLEEDTHPVTVAYSENTLISMQQQTGIEMPSARTLTAAASAKAKIAETNKVDAINAPAMMAVTNLAGEICLDLVTEEKAKAPATRRFFGQINFEVGPAAQSAAAKADIVRRMARNFWARPETLAEKTVLLTSFDTAATDSKRTDVTDAVDTEDMLIYTCTGMLASLDAIVFK